MRSVVAVIVQGGCGVCTCCSNRGGFDGGRSCVLDCQSFINHEKKTDHNEQLRYTYSVSGTAWMSVVLPFSRDTTPLATVLKPIE